MKHGLVGRGIFGNISVVNIKTFIPADRSTSSSDGKPLFYGEHDKVMLKETGEVFTVHADLSRDLNPGIVVKEQIGKLLRSGDVRPAGRTRQRLDLSAQIVAPEVAPPPPEGCARLEDVEEFFRELKAPRIVP